MCSFSSSHLQGLLYDSKSHSSEIEDPYADMPPLIPINDITQSEDDRMLNNLAMREDMLRRFSRFFLSRNCLNSIFIFSLLGLGQGLLSLNSHLTSIALVYGPSWLPNIAPVSVDLLSDFIDDVQTAISISMIWFALTYLEEAYARITRRDSMVNSIATEMVSLWLLTCLWISLSVKACRHYPVVQALDNFEQSINLGISGRTMIIAAMLTAVAFSVILAYLNFALTIFMDACKGDDWKFHYLLQSLETYPWFYTSLALEDEEACVEGSGRVSVDEKKGLEARNVVDISRQAVIMSVLS